MRKMIKPFSFSYTFNVFNFGQLVVRLLPLILDYVHKRSIVMVVYTLGFWVFMFFFKEKIFFIRICFIRIFLRPSVKKSVVVSIYDFWRYPINQKKKKKQQQFIENVRSWNVTSFTQATRLFLFFLMFTSTYPVTSRFFLKLPCRKGLSTL